jgi:hypothetical protein
MSQLNVSVLAAARETYTEQLKTHLTPLIYEGFVSLYEDSKAKENEKPEFGYNYLKQFQTMLKAIPYWNQSILEEETRRIINKFDFMMELLAAIFVSYVKILASVRIGGNGNNIRIKLPTQEIFIHTVYTKAAELIYYNPYKFSNHHLRENEEYIYEIICKSIDTTINSMIPIENILKEYLSNVFNISVKKESIVNKVEEAPFSAILNSNELENDLDGNFGNEANSINSHKSEASEINNDFTTGINSFKDNDILEDNFTAGPDPLSSDPLSSDPLSSDPFSSDVPASSSTDDIFNINNNSDTKNLSEDIDIFNGNNENESRDIFNNSAPTPPELDSSDIFSKNDNTSIKFKEDLL